VVESDNGLRKSHQMRWRKVDSMAALARCMGVVAGALPDGTAVIISGGFDDTMRGVAAGPTELRSAYSDRYGCRSSRHIIVTTAKAT
jgi:hypothetical protein